VSLNKLQYVNNYIINTYAFWKSVLHCHGWSDLCCRKCSPWEKIDMSIIV